MADLAETYRDLLNDDGFRATIDDDGDVVFKYEGGTYYISIYKDDERYFQLVFPAFWSIDSADELERAKTACVKTTQTVKAAKVYLVRDNTNVSASYEAFYPSPKEAMKVFKRSIGCIQSAASAFRDAMNKEG